MSEINIRGFDSSFTTEDEVIPLMRAKGITIVDYNPEVSKIVNMSKREIETLTLDTCATAVLQIGQHLIYLDNLYSVYNFIHTKLKTQFDRLSASFEKDEKRGKNVGEKRAFVYEDYPELEKLSEMVDNSKLEMELLRDKNKTMLEFLNTLKRKLDQLQFEYNNQYRTLS